MDINEIRDKKQQLEAHIKFLLSNFIKETDVIVKDVEIFSSIYFDGTQDIVKIEIKIEI